MSFGHSHSKAARRKADPSKPGEVGAPIPGAVTSLMIAEGEQVGKGDRLLIMEAMKMQTTVYAPVGGSVKEVLVKRNGGRKRSVVGN